MTDEQKQFTCPRCGTTAKYKGNVVNHLHNVSLCDPNVSNISREDALKSFQHEKKLPTIECEFCKKTISDRSYKRHLNSCSHRPFTLKQNEKKCNPCKETMEYKLMEEINNKLSTIIQIVKHSPQNLEAKAVDNVDVSIEGSLNDILHSIPLTKSTKKKAKIPHTLKIKCWNTYIGETVGKTKCLCCNNIDITQHNFHCGHVIAECNGGTLNIDNLRPICNVCNNSMGTIHLEHFKKEHFAQGLNVTDNNQNYGREE
jgi:hypothetical protein